MAKRVAPSPEQIAEMIQRHLDSNPNHSGLIPWKVAVSIVSTGLRTTRKFAEEWLQDAALSETHPVEITYASEGGFISGLLRKNEGQYAKITAPYIREAYSKCGYGDDYYGTIYVDMQGRLLTSEEARKSDYKAFDGTRFVVLPQVLREILAEAKTQRQAESASSEAEMFASQAAAQRLQGSSINMIRGLLVAADVDVRGVLRVRAGRMDEAFVGIDLMGVDLDKVAAILQAAGIKPVEG